MSLRARVLVGMAVVAVVLVAVAVAITHATRAHLVDQLDAQLEAAGVPFRLGGGLAVAGSPQSDGPERPSTFYVGVLGDDGTLRIVFGPNLGDDAPLPVVDLREVAAAAADGEPFTTASTAAGVRYRARALVEPRTSAVLVLALSLRDVDEAIERLVGVEVVATLAILGVLALVTWWVVHLGVRPIKRMTEAATAIAAGDLSHRVPPSVAGTEAAELGTALNQMLGNIEDAFDDRARSQERLQQFVADASHELRTPVATIRGYAELFRAGGLADPAELAEAMRRTEQEAVRMGTLVDDMLVLARLDQRRPLANEPVDVAALLDDAVRDARVVDPDRPIDIAIDGPLIVRGDADHIYQVLGNVMANARVHTPPRTSIDVRARHDGARAIVEISDHGDGMDPQTAARAFERFYRADPARTRDRGGSGLGLAIVEATVRALGGDVTLETSPGEGTTVRISLPLTEP
jgi:two-component system OmpR family sensor kinase